MIQENEIIMLALGISLFFFINANKIQTQRIPHWKILLISFKILLVGWFLTVAEGFLLNKLFNLFEHICYAGSAFFLSIWFYKITRKDRENT